MMRSNLPPFDFDLMFQGGLKGVLWIDTIQMLIVLGIGIANSAVGTNAVGGIDQVLNITTHNRRLVMAR